MKHMLLVRMPVSEDSSDVSPARWVAGHRLEDLSDATTVRVRDGKMLVTDGPFTRFKEYIAGFDVIETRSLDDAAAFAAGHPVARFGAIEVREVWEDFDALANAGREFADPSASSSYDGVQYVLLMAAAPGAPPVGHDVSDLPPYEWIDEMTRRGVPRTAHRLRPAEEPGVSATVRVRDGRTLVTHGPYAEVWEQVAGYEFLVAADLDDAIEIAALHPAASLGAVEIRPLRSLGG
jgi:hypothetical protein